MHIKVSNCQALALKGCMVLLCEKTPDSTHQTVASPSPVKSAHHEGAAALL